jgi:hypothetical protein
MTDTTIIILSISFMVGMGLITIAIKWVSDSINNLTKEVGVIIDELRIIRCHLDLIRWHMSRREKKR